MIKAAINGFGRIGRPVLKIALENPEIEIVAINDLGDNKNLAYLLKHDSAYGKYEKKVEVQEDNLVINGNKIKIFSEKDPKNLPWSELGVDVVFECTGIFKDREGAGAHLEAGAKKVLISAPTKDETIKTVVLGVNEEEITSEDDILANASCTTNCLAPMMKVLKENFGVEKSIMSTIHSYTSTQEIVDGLGGKDFRRGRAGAQNIVPTSTGAAIATTLTLPDLKGKFDGMAFRIPTLVGSVSDVVCLLKKEVTEEEVNKAFQEAAQGKMKNIIEYTEEPLVSTDIIGNSHSSIFQGDLTKVVSGNLVKIVGWYDNEWGYSCRMVDLALFIMKK